MMSPGREHRPTDDQDRPHRRSRTSCRRPVGAASAALLILVTACGGSDDDGSGDAEAAAPETESAANAAPAPTDAPTEPTDPEATEPEATEPEPDTTEATDADSATTSVVEDGPQPAAEWAESMITAWNDYRAAGVEGLIDSREAQLQGVHRFDHMRSDLSSELATLEAYAAALDVRADDPALDASADPMRAVIDEQIALATTVQELSEEDPDRVRKEIDDAEAANPGSLPRTPWGDAFAAYVDDELWEREEAACFDLQDAIDAAGYGLVDCAGSSIEIPPIGDLLEPGVHELTTAAPGLTLDLAQPTFVFEAGDFVQASDPESKVSADFLSVDEVVDPSSLTAPDAQATMPIPDDLGPWLAQFPVTVLAEGMVDTATGPAPYWDLQVDAGRAAEMAPGSFIIELARYAVNDSFASHQLIGGPPVPDQHFVIVDWRRGEDRFLVYGIAELDQPLFEWMETMLAAAS